MVSKRDEHWAVSAITARSKILRKHAIGAMMRERQVCTTPAAVIKSLLDRMFLERLRSSRSEKSFVKISAKEFFFVLVCRTVPLLEIFFGPAKTAPPSGLTSREDIHFLQQ